MKKDLVLVTVIGFLFGWLIALPAKSVGFSITPQFILISVFGFTLLAPVALLTLRFLSRFFAPLYQFGKFAAVGALNSLIDLGVLNLLILLTGVFTGGYFSLFKTLSFVVAVVNSYFWNKFWTFQSAAPVTFKEFGRFLFFTGIGLLINVSVASLVVALAASQLGKPSVLWANIGAVIAIVVALAWNFFSYRYIVFKSVSNVKSVVDKRTI